MQINDLLCPSEGGDQNCLTFKNYGKPFKALQWSECSYIIFAHELECSNQKPATATSLIVKGPKRPELCLNRIIM